MKHSRTSTFRPCRLGSLTLVCLASASPALGDALSSQANQRNMLPGGRAAMMGGAFTAVADDATGGYYNPAGLAFCKDERLEVSGNAYRTTSVVYKDTVNGKPFDEKSSEIYPAFVGGTLPLGRVTLGYSFLTLDARNVYQENAFEDIAVISGTPSSYSRSYQEASRYIWAGTSAALRLGKAWSLGLSVFYYQRSIEFSTHELIQLNGGGFVTINDTLKALNTGAAGVFGALYHGDHVAVGMSLKMARAFSDRSALLIDEIAYDPSIAEGEPQVTRTRLAYPPSNELNPKTYTLGLAWYPTPVLLLTADALLHEGVSSPYKTQGGRDLHTTVNYSAGMQVRLGPAAVMGGIFTNNSLYRAPKEGVSDQPLMIDYRGFTGGIGWDVSGFSGQVGVVRQLGRGWAQIRRGSTAIQGVEAQMTTYLISGKVPL